MEENVITPTDRISELPECIAHHIISFLNSPPDLVRCSVLSKKWFDVTASFPILDFDRDEFIKAIRPSRTRRARRSDRRVSDFYKYVVYTTSRFCEQNISVHTFNLHTEFNDTAKVDIMKKCLRLVLMKGVKVFSFHNTDHEPRYHLPDILLSVSSLSSMSLTNCDLPSSMMVNAIMFKSLKVLRFSAVPLHEEVIKRLTSSCPLLEEFDIVHCHGLKRICVYGLQNLKKFRFMYAFGVKRIDIEAPSLCECDISLTCDEEEDAPSLNLASCKQLRTLHLRGEFFATSKGFTDYLSNFPFLENLLLRCHNEWNSLNLSSPSLRKLVLQTCCDLDGIDINTPNLLLFTESKQAYPYEKDLRHSKAHMECYRIFDVDALWFQKLRRFLNKTSRFKVLKLDIMQASVNMEELKVIQLPPYELEHVELEFQAIETIQDYFNVVDAVLWCCRPRFLTLTLRTAYPSLDFEERKHVIKFTYEKLFQQEDQGQTDIGFVLSFPSKTQRQFSNLDLLLNALRRKRSTITFVKDYVPISNDRVKGM